MTVEELQRSWREEPKPAETWIEWKGGENPVPGKRVKYKMSNQDSSLASSDNLRWERTGSEDDIVAYRVVE